jgi:hypothetical protein
MNSKQLVEKHLQERIDLDAMQSQELKQMLSRHDKEQKENPYSKYFARKRYEQLENLLRRHKTELEGLYDSHEQEYQNWQKIKQVIRDGKQLSFESEPKHQPYQPKYEPGQRSKLDKLVQFFKQVQKKGHGQQQ